MRTELLNRNLLITLAIFALAAAGCGGGGEMAPEEPMEMEAEEPAADAAPSGPPRVFFVAPLDGEAMSSDHDVEIEMGAENYPISAIPEGFDPENDTPRPGMGHYHVGLNTGCLPVGEVIPQGQGWQHFGDGSNAYTLQVEPGTYELTVQIGDDLHVTQEGLCETISIEVADGI
ncbi:MAG: DUF4399 domain-containing protein [Acidobacteria bacterium]|nr:DUF4399 domain-containing protein [Acidobacteriota bacterium]MXZ70535.1 DUF4399 domain-containing protein [Acidobacteriota bacterium]MYD71681.1 DUF4399 domain-containing protein [Acidobacteriota bacterium]MYJ05945.1 DUF4399 domain-containing protein [Acidobacteriota bacterium]